MRRGWFWACAVTAATAAAGAVVGLILASSASGGSGGGGSHTPAAPVAAQSFSAPVLGHPTQHVSLSAYAGKPVIINFFASWCAPCQRETPLLARFSRSSQGRVRIVGIDVNDPTGAAKAFVRKTGVSYPVGVDSPPMPISAAYSVSGLPQTFFLNARHQIVKRVFGALTAGELARGTALMNHRTK